MNEETKIPNNSEIDQALKEFEMKSQGVQEGPAIPVSAQKSDMPHMVQLVVKWSGGAIKDQKTAEYVLLGVAILMFFISFYFFFRGGSSVSELSPEELRQMEEFLPS